MSAECHKHGIDIVYPKGTWPVGICTVCEQEFERNELLDLLRASVITSDSSLIDEDHNCDDLFDKGLVRLERDFTDEYLTVLTDKGREAIKHRLNWLSTKKEN